MMPISSQIKHGKPFLRWAGSKRQLIPELSKYWNFSYNRYIEPFAGSACFFFNIVPSIAILGDINKDLMMTYEQVKNNIDNVLSTLNKMEIGKQYYMDLRSLDPNELSPTTRAARFIYLNRFCFNGLYRTNRLGQFNVPYSGYRTGNIPSNDLLKQCSSQLKKTNLITGSFELTLENALPGDFIYMDPPFSVNGRRIFNEYDVAVFNQRQIKLLRDWLIILDNKRIAFLVSYAESEEGEFLGHGFYKEVVSVRRNIAGFASNRRIANELLITNIKLKP